jgi:hypothetical protein
MPGRLNASILSTSTNTYVRNLQQATSNQRNKKFNLFDVYLTSAAAAAAATAAAVIVTNSKTECSPADQAQQKVERNHIWDTFAELETGEKFPKSIAPPKLIDDKSGNLHCFAWAKTLAHLTHHLQSSPSLNISSASVCDV